MDNKMSLREKLREKREDMKLTQGEIGKRLGIKQATVSIYERDEAALKAKGHAFARSFIEAYGYGEDEALRLTQQLFEHDFASLYERPPGLLRVAEGSRVRFLGHINAGMTTAYFADNEGWVSVPDWIADRYDLERIFAVDVMGDSMTCEDVKKRINEGDRVYFVEGVLASSGEIICCRLCDEGIFVLKVFKPQDGYTILESYNREHDPIIVNEDNPGDIVGVYLTHIPRGPRLR